MWPDPNRPGAARTPQPGPAVVVKHAVASFYAQELVDVWTIDATAGNITATLPPPEICSGVIIRFKRVDSSANTVTIQPQAAGYGGDQAAKIDGASSVPLGSQWASVALVSDGLDFYKV